MTHNTINASFVAAAILAVVGTLMLPPGAAAQIPEPIAASGEVTIAQFHGVGAQVYQCKTGGAGKLAWQFREPIATLLSDDKTMGRHFAGPTWEFADGTSITGKVAASAPGATRDDIPWLRLAVTSVHGSGPISAATAVQRINTKGGALSGPCDRAGAFVSVPYAADYIFLHKN